jgi:class 3 adenylate cyclase
MTGDRKLIMVVDDAPANIQIVHAILQDEYRTRVATTPARALALARTEPLPDLILLDVVMPEMDGYQVCTALKADPLTRDIPVIFLTGQTEVADETRGFESGAVDYVHKPFSPPVMKARIRTHLALRESLEQVSREKERADSLLASLLPETAVQEIQATGMLKPRRYENVAVLFCDLVGFTRHCDQHEAEEVVRDLGVLFLEFEERARKRGLEKVKTVGDAFLATANLLAPVSDPVRAAIACAMELCAAARSSSRKWDVRAGVHAGPVVAGIVGQERYQFDIWGDTVNVAARLTAAATPGAVAMLAEIAAQQGVNSTEARTVELKGKGSMRVVEISTVPERDNS